MTAARHASGNPGPGARKTARWLILAIALVVVVPAALAGIIYILVTGTEAEAWGMTGLTALVALGAVLVSRERDQAFWAWMMAGLVLSAAAQILGSLAGGHGRPAAQAHTMSPLGSGVRAAGITCTCLAVAYHLRSVTLPWLRRRAAAREK
jgi:hypothetical protein